MAKMGTILIAGLVTRITKCLTTTNCNATRIIRAGTLTMAGAIDGAIIRAEAIAGTPVVTITKAGTTVVTITKAGTVARVTITKAGAVARVIVRTIIKAGIELVESA